MGICESEKCVYMKHEISCVLKCPRCVRLCYYCVLCEKGWYYNYMNELIKHDCSKVNKA